MTSARIELAPEVAEDVERILDHLYQHEEPDPGARIRGIIEALDILANNPQIGRPAANEMCELVIGRREQGCLALYHYFEEIDTVFVLAIRSQRAAGYRGFE